MNAHFSPILRGRGEKKGGGGGGWGWAGGLLREGREHAEVSKVLYVVVGCSLGWISGHG